VQLIGPEVAAKLEALAPGDFISLQPGRIRYTLLLNETGGILDDLMVTNTGHHLYVVINGAVKHADLAHMRAKLPADITINYFEDSAALLALQGPKAVEALQRLVPGVAQLVFMQAAPFQWGDVPLGISRSGYTGEDGFEISVPAAQATRFAEALLEQPEVKPVGLGARDSLRLEAGLPLYGHDIDTTTTPVEADLGFAISKRRKTEGGFPGADVIMPQVIAGAARKRVGLRVEGRLPAREGAVIYQGEAQVGVVTSGGFSPSCQAPIAMGYVAASCSADGTALEIDVRGKRLAATVSPMPFVAHRYVRKV
jgi:aminomethyltransferase